MLTFLFLLVWIIFNGKVTIEIVLFGLGIGLLMDLFVARFMGYKPVIGIQVFRLLLPGLGYIFVLFWEIVKANIATAKLLLTSKYELEPILVSFDVPLQTQFARVVLANSITLTPGTITVNLEENHYVVHCLDKDMAAGMDESVFVRLLSKMEQKIAVNEEKVEK